jgi:uncharacterized protein YndB with AHSA1/START domain
MLGDQPGGPIRWQLHLPVPPERVFASLDSGKERAAYWAESAEETGAGIEFRFINGYRHTSRIIERIPSKRWAIEYIGGEAAFDLTPDGRGGTDLLLTHRGIGTEQWNEEWNEVHAGWLNVLLPLKAWLLQGVDLRNHDPTRTWDQGYADQ